MRKELHGILCIVCGLVLATTLVTVGPATAATTSLNQQTPEETQSVSGTIASVEKNSFTLTVGSAMSQGQQDTPRSMTFMIDKNTTVDGKLRVGANADVTYRQAEGTYIAINVRVASKSE